MTDCAPSPEALQFCSALFEPPDTILFRPIETWTEDGKKKSRVDYKRVLYRGADPSLLAITIDQMQRWSDVERFNVFFGVCPRLGDKGRFDLAWQIRKVTALWCDIDHCTEEEALARCAAAGLPPPSIVVNSGNGVHLYWLLATPYLITDAGEPFPVLTEWPETGKPPRRYFVDEHGEQISVLQRHLHPKLSSQAQLVQDVLSGIAAKVGGDHTTDLTRLLRVPGTLNRKDQRNGREPVPCTLSRCDASCRYAFDDFRALAVESPDAKRRAAIATMPLKQARRISPGNRDKLEDWIARSTVAEQGTRSEVDFGLCCFALRHGVAKEELWNRVQSIGKFAEGGERYFERTWEQAEESVRTDKYLELTKPSALSAALQDDFRELEPANHNPSSCSIRDRTISVDPAVNPVSATMGQITDVLLSTGTAYSRVAQCVVLRDQKLATLSTPQELAGHLNQYVEFRFIDGEEGAYKPLPPTYGNTWLHHPAEMARLPTIKLYTRSPVYTNDWRLVAPGYDSESGVYFAGEAIEPQSGTAHLDALLSEFCFRSASDRTNFVGMLLTIPLVYHFIGSKPAILFNGNQPGVGKTILAQLIAILRDGSEANTASYNSNDEEFEKRLASIVRTGALTLLIDNAKTNRRSACIDSPCLERIITDEVISFRLLGSSADIRAENSHFFCITANSADVSRDLLTRCVIVNLEYEGDPSKRKFAIADPQGYARQHRNHILGELLGMVERWKNAGCPEANVNTRFNKRGWGRIVGGILAVNGYNDFLANTEASATEFDQTRREFAELVKLLADYPGRTYRSSELTALAVQHQLLGNELGDGSERSQTTRMGLLTMRYVAERFPLETERLAVFHRTTDRKGPLFRVEIETMETAEVAVPDVATELPDVEIPRSGGSKCLETSTLPDVPDVARPSSVLLRVREMHAMHVTHTHEMGALDKRLARPQRLADGQRLAVTGCDHLDPASWVRRDGAAYCGTCEKFMGKLSS